jgi:hypothetical protein
MLVTAREQIRAFDDRVRTASEASVWHPLLKAALTWCALSALWVCCWIVVREISLQIASRVRRRAELAKQLPQANMERTCKE